MKEKGSGGAPHELWVTSGCLTPAQVSQSFMHPFFTIASYNGFVVDK